MFKEDKGECALGQDKGGYCSSGRAIQKIEEYVGIDCGKKKDCQRTVVKTAMKKLGVKREMDIFSHESFVDRVGRIDNQELLQWFKTRGPRDNNNLLSNVDIEAKLSEWLRGVSDVRFLHIPFEMIDFKYKSGSMLQNINLQDVVGKYDIAACVLNTDVWSGGGKHWFCIVIDLDPQCVTIEFFNSSGFPPSSEIIEWKEKKMSDLVIAGIKCKFKRVVNFKMQKSRTECGMFCLSYIRARLMGITPAECCRILTDKSVYETRNVFFN
jgi:hypothetical protein